MSHKQSARKQAEKFGIDMSLLEANLTMSYTQRVINFQKALILFETLKKAGKAYYDRLQTADRKATR